MVDRSAFTTQHHAHCFLEQGLFDSAHVTHQRHMNPDREMIRANENALEWIVVDLLDQEPGVVH